jgi:3-oxoacyl-[acyl-carrier-protein] synthase III
MPLYLHGLGHFHPENEITNRFLEELDIGTTEEWILERVGIRSRRTVLPLDYIRDTLNRDIRAAYEASPYGNARTGALAARMAIGRAGIAPGEVGLVICGGSAPDTLTPAEAASVAGELDLDAPCFDLNSACTSFGMQVAFVSRMDPAHLPDYVLLVNPENLTRSIDYSDRKTAVLFGDGSAAAVLSASVPSRIRIDHCETSTKPSAWGKVSIPRTGHFTQDGNAVQGFAIRKTTESLQSLRGEGAENGNRLLFIGHQANLGMLQSVCVRAGIAEASHWHNVEDFGNTGAAGAPSVLSQRWEDLRAGDRVAVALVGAGLSWTSMELQVRSRA